MARLRLWVDTDVGDDPDDVVALACAAAHPDVDLVGVSVVPDVPIVRPDLAAELVTAPVHLGDRPADLVDAFRVAAPDAVVAIGPLANVAALLAARVDLPDLTVMGGVLAPVRHRGRILTAEHNFATHPGATAMVVAATDAVIVPLDVTVAMRVPTPELARLVGAIAPLGREVADWERRRRAEGVADEDLALVLHDPLALLVALRDVDASRASRRLVVDATTGFVRDDDHGRVHDVVTRADATRALARVLDLCGA